MLINAVAPFAGAWIEMHRPLSCPQILRSLPSRERGLKSPTAPACTATCPSLPSRERGLKSTLPRPKWQTAQVAPFAGAWIEMQTVNRKPPSIVSLPSRERGLKSVLIPVILILCKVAPFAGAWIEIFFQSAPADARPRRSLRGSVD